MQVAHRTQHVGAVGALAAARLDQAACLEMHEHPVEQQILGMASQQAPPELGEHAEVKAGVVKLEPQSVLPVDARAHGVGGLPVAHVLEKLQHRDECQSPGCQRRLPATWIQSSEILVAVQIGELVAQPRDHRAARKSGMSHTHRLARNRADRARTQAHENLRK